MSQTAFTIKLYADGADLDDISRMKGNPLVSGFTTNPSLVRKAGVENYLEFATSASKLVGNLPISLEVISDNFVEMEAQARKLSNLGSNVFVKIPITNSTGDSSVRLIQRLSADFVPLNVTAIFTREQFLRVTDVINDKSLAVMSVFAGRIADTGVDPYPMMAEFAELLKNRPNMELLWASPRELLNVFQAQKAGCDIITIPSEIWNKFGNIGKPLEDFSRETVQMFYDDAIRSGFEL